MRSSALAHRSRLGQVPVTTLDLLDEVAVSQYALHAGVHQQHIRPVWRDLWRHVASHLIAGKVSPAVSLCSAQSSLFQAAGVHLCLMQGVLLHPLGSILLQPAGAAGLHQPVPTLHPTSSLAVRFIGGENSIK